MPCNRVNFRVTGRNSLRRGYRYVRDSLKTEKQFSAVTFESPE